MTKVRPSSSIGHPRPWLTWVKHVRRLSSLRRRTGAFLQVLRGRRSRSSCTWGWRHGHELPLPCGGYITHLRAVHVLRRSMLVHGRREWHLAHELLRDSTVGHGSALHTGRHLHGLHHTRLSALWHAWLRLAAGILVRSASVGLVHHPKGLLLRSWSVGPARSGRSRHWSGWPRTCLRSRHGHLTRVNRLRDRLWCLRMHTRLHHCRHVQASAVIDSANNKVLTERLAAKGPHGTNRLGIGHLAHLERIEVLSNVETSTRARSGLFDDLVAKEGICGWRCRGRGCG